MPDPHGNVAGLWSDPGAAFVDAFRYDPWGETLAASPASGARTPWRYQGRMVEGEPTDAESYDFGFRSYLADTGTFGSLDDVAGSAADVRSLNRFVYAAADPVTLIDPDGHRPLEGSADSQAEKVSTTVTKHQQQAVAQTAKANKANGWTTYRRTTVSLTKPKPPMTLTRADAWADEAPTYAPEGTGGFDLGGFVHGALDVIGIIPIAGAIPDLINAGIYAAEGDVGMALLSVTAAVPIVGDGVGVGKLALKYGDNVIGAVAHYGDEVVEAAGAAMRRVDDVPADVGKAAERAADDVVPEHLYRSGTGTPESVTPRLGKDEQGLSAWDTLDGAGVRPGEKYVRIRTKELDCLCARPDRGGHYSIRPKDMTEMPAWIASRGRSPNHPLTDELLNASKSFRRPR